MCQRQLNFIMSSLNVSLYPANDSILRSSLAHSTGILERNAIAVAINTISSQEPGLTTIQESKNQY